MDKNNKYDVIIGLEIHAELKTKSKMFCDCNNDSEHTLPNANTCPICLGHPGTLPAVNQQAINYALMLGIVLNCKINKFCKFDRKNYFYPDLPKGYQISQYDLPICHHGYLEIENGKIDITRIHLEEDTGKLIHLSNTSLVDYNRAGTPLIEMVTEPMITSGKQARQFCQKYQQILRYLNISNADMEKGEMRCEANVSLQEKGKWQYNGKIKPITGYKLNHKVEVKNINSFRALEKAINFEIERQTKALDNKEKIIAETRGWDDKSNETKAQRRKETSADYRYFPEPDIPPLQITDNLIEKIKKELPEMPAEKITRFKTEYNLNQADAELLTSNNELADYAENVISELRAWVDASGDDWERQKNRLSKIATNWLSTELLKHLKINNHTIKDVKITPENFAELITLVYEEKINSSAGQMIMNQMYQIGGDPSQIMEKMNLQQMDNSKDLKKAVEIIIQEYPEQVAEYKSGKTNLIKFFIGKAMADTEGKANPKILKEILEQELEK
ncbi:MAG: Asp-tRNA(Asn)/Glu-tRNA(Gln) amidotransferase subunit GatB [bacterium]